MTEGKQALYGNYLAGQQWRQKLAKKATHMALDIPEDDVQITNQNQTGMGWKELATIGAVMLGLGWAWVFHASAPSTAPAVPDSEYNVRFYDAQGQPIEVPRLPPELRK